MELLLKVKRVLSAPSDMGKTKDRTETTEVTYTVLGELSEESSLRMREEFTEMISAMFGPKTVIEPYATE